MTLVVVVVAAVVAIATYLTWLARRLDRLGVRVDAARAGLLTQLVARAAAAAALASSRGLAPLEAVAEQSAAGHLALRSGAPLDTAVEETENQLSRALRAPEVASSGQGAPELLHAVDSAAARVALARQLHNDAVRDLRALRGRRLVRVLRLGGRRPLPAYFEIDDALPAWVETPFVPAAGDIPFRRPVADAAAALGDVPDTQPEAAP
ncbi:hypothetical protein [Pseudofrankia inefficax]|uniref:NUDIX hydrolase n=1 Tax=Pseudofrankia inefficax (strain DSM 45817 / CECT 9037 / DDB 130130 / EuI1c) TaxID=298654 RepID=E3J080_PSEI1|nr:hypothetical protein [Pseudofrankia inefficax]ADP80363.1 hypothetical protein FraEuI1c_2324 [Pseudofrankia inefficax]